jgi:hypothetical protein
MLVFLQKKEIGTIKKTLKNLNLKKRIGATRANLNATQERGQKEKEEKKKNY